MVCVGKPRHRWPVFTVGREGTAGLRVAPGLGQRLLRLGCWRESKGGDQLMRGAGGQGQGQNSQADRPPSPERPLRSISFCNAAVREEGPTWRGQGSGWRAGLQGRGGKDPRQEGLTHGTL